MKRDILILLSGAALVLLVNLGAGSLGSWDESVYAQVSREILKNNDWICLRWGSYPWYDKPPLYMWATAFFYNVFGVNEFSARLFSALSGIALVFVAYLFGAKLFSRRVGLISGVMLLGTYHFIWFSRMAFLDVTFTLFFTLSIYFFLLAENKNRYVLYSFICFSLAFLTKGIVAFLIPIIMAGYVLTSTKWHMIFNRYTVFGFSVFLLITASWYAPVISRYGMPFIEGHFLQNLIKRSSSAMDGHSGTWLTYINVVLYKGKVWGTVGAAIFPFFILWIVKRRFMPGALLVLWILTVLLAFSAAKTKLHWYIMPVYPALIIVAAWGVDKLLRRYSLLLTVLLSAGALFYFGMGKDIFGLDNNPKTKQFSLELLGKLGDNQELYLYNIQDPGARFYLGRKARYLKDINDLKGHENRPRVIVMPLEEPGKPKGTILIEDKGAGYIAIIQDNG